jgi:GTP-binding protein Era
MNQVINTKSNWITFIGAPNAGKSTLLNKLIGTKISIVTPKVQTTRTMLKGIKVIDNTQLVFTDTPGIFQKAKTKLEKYMLSCAWSSLQEANQICLLVDCTKYDELNTQYLIEQLISQNVKVILIINKIDLIKKPLLLPVVEKLSKNQNIFEKIFMISALEDDGVKDLEEYFLQTAKPSPWFFNGEDITDAPMRFLVAEMVREKVFLFTNQELPYNIAIETETWDESDKLVSIRVSIKVIRLGHKKIIIGHAGQLIKKIGTKARQDIEALIGKKVFLSLFVKVTDWDKNIHESVSF